MNSRMDLTPAQKEQIQSGLSQYNLSHAPSSAAKAAIALAQASGNLAEAIRLQVDYNKREVQDKLRLFEGILTPVQLQTYKQCQLDRIEIPLRMLLPQTTSNTAQ